MQKETHIPPFLITRPGYPLRARLLYRQTMYVTVFGIERNEYQGVIYYWVVDGEEKRFKAYPNELTQ